MEAIFASAVAVLGTLLGSLATYWIQRSTVRQQQGLAEAERRRQERLEAISAYVEALTIYRRVRKDRWHSVNEEREDQDDVRRRDNDVRAAAYAARRKVQLLVDDRAIREQCHQTLLLVDKIKHDTSTSVEELNERLAESRRAIDQLIDTARVLLDQTQAA